MQMTDSFGGRYKLKAFFDTVNLDKLISLVMTDVKMEN